jgi:hypothetical protein
MITGLRWLKQIKGNNTAVYFRPDAAANQDGRDYDGCGGKILLV